MHFEGTQKFVDKDVTTGYFLGVSDYFYWTHLAFRDLRTMFQSKHSTIINLDSESYVDAFEKVTDHKYLSY